MEKEIIILAKSSKHGEYCIAGVDSKSGEWIRPVSDNITNEGSIPLQDITYEDGTQIQILDQVKIEFLSHNQLNLSQRIIDMILLYVGGKQVIVH